LAVRAGIKFQQFVLSLFYVPLFFCAAAYLFRLIYCIQNLINCVFPAPSGGQWRRVGHIFNQSNSFNNFSSADGCMPGSAACAASEHALILKQYIILKKPVKRKGRGRGMKQRGKKVVILVAAAAWCVMWGLCAQAASTISDADWVPMNSTPNWEAGSVKAIAVDPSGAVYAGGKFDIIGGIAAHKIAKWDGTLWSALGSGLSGGGFPTVSALAVDASGNVYVGGAFTTARNGTDNDTDNVTVNGIAKWDGASWSALGSGVGGRYPYVSALAFDPSGNLYAGGTFTTAGGVTVNGLAKWDGASWSSLGSGLGGIVTSPLQSPNLPSVSALAFDTEGNLYAGGSFMKAGGVWSYSIAKWDSTSWSALGWGLGMQYWWLSMYPNVNALAVDASGDLYVGGTFISTAGLVVVNNIAKWDGTSWSPLGSGTGSLYRPVNALAIDASGNLYAGGNFSTAGGVAVSCIAKWDGTSWSPLGSGTGGDYPKVNALAIDASGNLYAGGDFTQAGGKTSYYIAQCILPKDTGTATTTTTIGCPATQVLGADNPNLERFRHFRDSTLAGSLWGMKLIQIYYDNAGGINAALERSPELRAYARRLLEAIAPMMKR
jgi:hypothetical protein